MRMKLKVCLTEILQYGLILLALFFQGSVSYKYNEPQFLILAAVIGMPLLIQKKYRIIRKSNLINYYSWIFIIILLLFGSLIVGKM